MNEYINKVGITYAVLAVLVDEEKTLNSEVVALSGQMIITNLINPQEVLNRIESSRKKIASKYGVDEVDGEIIIKLRVISYDDKVYKNVLNIPHIEEVYQQKSLDVLKFNDDSMPLTTDLDKYG